jgi:hypothetical protein
MAERKNKLCGRPASPWRFWLPRAAFAIVAPVLLLALTEAAWRLFHVGYSGTDGTMHHSWSPIVMLLLTVVRI